MIHSINWMVLIGDALVALALVLVAGAAGWWFGRRREPVVAPVVAPVVKAIRAPVSDSLMGEAGVELTKVQSFNQLVRSIITLTLCGTVVGGFFLGKISADFIMGLASGALSYWFARDTQSAATKESVALLQTPPPDPTRAKV